MNAQLSALPMPWSLIAYVILGIGWLAGGWFLARYTLTRPWYLTEIGRHLVAFSTAVFLFFTLYLMLAIWPNFPGRGAIRFGLLIFLVAVVVWRAVIFERTDRADRKARREESG